LIFLQSICDTTANVSVKQQKGTWQIFFPTLVKMAVLFPKGYLSLSQFSVCVFTFSEAKVTYLIWKCCEISLELQRRCVTFPFSPQAGPARHPISQEYARAGSRLRPFRRVCSKDRIWAGVQKSARKFPL